MFNLFNLLIAIALIAVKAYTNLAYMLIIVVNIIIGVVQEIHARNLVQKLSVLKVSKANVIRDGKEKEIKLPKKPFHVCISADTKGLLSYLNLIFG